MRVGTKAETEMTDKLTISKAQGQMKEHLGHTQNLSTGECFNRTCIEAKGFISGFDQGVRAAAEKIKGYPYLQKRVASLLSDKGTEK